MDPDQSQWVPMAEHEDVLRAQEKLQSQIDSFQAIIGQQAPNEPDTFEIAPPNQDSILKVYQKQINLKVDLPLLFTEAMVAPKLMKQFHDLATSSQGELKLLAYSEQVQDAIREIIDEHGADNLDLLIVLDRTHSMIDDIDDVREGLKEILEGLQAYPNSRLALATYADKNYDTNWYHFEEFGTNHAKMGAYLETITHSNGVDIRESVYDGLYRALEEGFFQSRSKRMVILIGDAAGHEDEKTKYKLRDVIRVSRRDRVKMNFYPIIIHPGLRSLTGASAARPKSDQVPLIESIYPNPSSGLVNLSFYKEQPLAVSVYNQAGKLIRTYNCETRELRIDLTNQNDGLYIVRAVYKDRQFDQRKLILKK